MTLFDAAIRAEIHEISSQTETPDREVAATAPGVSGDVLPL